MRARDKVLRDAPCNGILPCARVTSLPVVFSCITARAHFYARKSKAPSLSLPGHSPRRVHSAMRNTKKRLHIHETKEVIFLYIYRACVTTRASSATSIDLSRLFIFLPIGCEKKYLPVLYVSVFVSFSSCQIYGVKALSFHGHGFSDNPRYPGPGFSRTVFFSFIFFLPYV